MHFSSLKRNEISLNLTQVSCSNCAIFVKWYNNPDPLKHNFCHTVQELKIFELGKSNWRPNVDGERVSYGDPDLLISGGFFK